MNRTLKFINTLIFSILFILLVVSFSIAVPILFRPLYYMLIDPLKITSLTGFSKEELIFSFNELMDCLVLYKEPFSEGVFTFSEEGMNHFLDCRILFSLDIIVFLISLPLFFLYIIMIKKNKIKIYHPFHASPLFLASFVPLILLSSFALYALIDVDAAFTFFHSVLFSGKSNWIFNPKTDPIINALPMEFFLICGGIILGIMMIIIIFTIVRNSIKIYKYNNVISYKAK